MKKNKFLGIVGLLIFTVLFAISCDLFEVNPFKGTWVTIEGTTLVFEDSTWRMNTFIGGAGLRGTYTYSDNTATLTYTQISIDNGATWRPITSSEASGYSRTATVSGDTLRWGVRTYARQ
ncbi:MAG: hypothetical protein FWG77_03730 [Treponema sp.]|nr:hypothetical protein [Treponema sp.]